MRLSFGFDQKVNCCENGIIPQWEIFVLESINQHTYVFSTFLSKREIVGGSKLMNVK